METMLRKKRKGKGRQSREGGKVGHTLLGDVALI
jgi:hypothetical protein